MFERTKFILFQIFEYAITNNFCSNISLNTMRFVDNGTKMCDKKIYGR